MNLVGYVACYLSIFLNLVVLVWCYSKIDENEKMSSKIKCLLVISLISALMFFINVYINTNAKLLLIYLLLCVLFYHTFTKSDKLFSLFIKTLIIYVIMIISDVISSVILMQFNFSKISEEINILKALGTFLNSVSMILIFNFKKFVIYFKKALNFIIFDRNSIGILICVMLFITSWLIDCFHRDNATISTFLLSCFVLLFLIFLISILFYQYFKRKKVEEEKQKLMDLMQEYEAVLNQTSDNRHEILNDLLTLRSISDKNSLSFSRTLDSIIRQYDTKKYKKYTSLAKLPSGVKGMIYYKIAYIGENEINFSTVATINDFNRFESMDGELYYKVCKVLGILMDNAIDACVESVDKKLVISVYSIKDGLCVEIDNSYSKDISLDDLNVKGFTTKGKNHGRGLAILNKIVEENEFLEFEQCLNIVSKVFTSILKIKL